MKRKRSLDIAVLLSVVAVVAVVTLRAREPHPWVRPRQLVDLPQATTVNWHGQFDIEGIQLGARPSRMPGVRFIGGKDGWTQYEFYAPEGPGNATQDVLINAWGDEQVTSSPSTPWTGTIYQVVGHQLDQQNKCVLSTDDPREKVLRVLGNPDAVLPVQNMMKQLGSEGAVPGRLELSKVPYISSADEILGYHPRMEEMGQLDILMVFLRHKQVCGLLIFSQIFSD